MLKKLIFFILTLFIASLLYISFFNRFQTDDYFLAWNLMEFGALGSWIETYTQWSGRYFSFSLVKLTPLLFHQYDIYPTLSVIFSIFLLAWSSFLLLKNYFENTFKNSWIKSIVFCALYFLLSLNLGEHLYWNAGAKIYFFPFIYFLFFLHILYLNNRNGKWFYTFVLYFLTFVIIGSNEIIATMFCGTLFFIQRKQKIYRSLFFFGILCMMFSFLAPGNFVRMGYKNDISWLKKIATSIFIFGRASLFSLLKTLILVPIIHLFFGKDLHQLNKEKINFIILTLTFIGILVLSFLRAASLRTSDTFLIFYVFCVALFLFQKRNLQDWAWLSIIFILLPPIKISSYKKYFLEVNFNFSNAITDIYYRKKNLQGFKHEIKKREQYIENSVSDTILLSPIQNIPKTLYFQEVPNENYRNYINDQLEKYYDKKSVSLKP